MEQLADSIPDCTIGTSSSSKKASLLLSLDICATPTPVPTPASTASTTNCSSAVTNETFNMFLEASEDEACKSSATLQMYYLTFDTPCNSSCASVLHDLETALPNCYFERDDNNKKEYLGQQFGFCEQLDNDHNISISIKADHLLSDPNFVPNCTVEEVQQTLDFYLTISTNESCVNKSSICSHDIRFDAGCYSECGEFIQDLYYDLPECYYDHENYKERTMKSQSQCMFIANPDPIRLTFHYLDVITTDKTTSVSCDPKYDSTISLSKAESHDVDPDTSQSSSSSRDTKAQDLCIFSVLATLFSIFVTV
ncbi:hypothetical protein PHYBOEH_009625 [Phytophthora boehmeriae]|uniref:Elicitin n=1 Tax=Phytophthora boehmeriae TaxID=109152 RepID=A0A8T1VVC4_9STRA|nr:hypothetical protein PHYBOEH_009625 [Phytophthora boehmeriae]